MSESNEHMELVSTVYSYVKDIVPNELINIIKADTNYTEKPSKVIGNYIPDVFYWHDSKMIIGEAKTINDFSRDHSKRQYEAYIDECTSFYGDSIIVIGVPWEIVVTAKNYFRLLKTKKSLKSKIVIINELGRGYEI